jgi:hypothetical protein
MLDAVWSIYQRYLTELDWALHCSICVLGKVRRCIDLICVVLLQHFLQQQARPCALPLHCIRIYIVPQCRAWHVGSCCKACNDPTIAQILMQSLKLQFWREYTRRRNMHAAAPESGAGQA